MAIWKDSNTQRQAAPAPSAPEAPDTHRMDLNSRAEPAPVVPVLWAGLPRLAASGGVAHLQLQAAKPVTGRVACRGTRAGAG